MASNESFADTRTQRNIVPHTSIKGSNLFLFAPVLASLISIMKISALLLLVVAATTSVNAIFTPRSRAPVATGKKASFSYSQMKGTTALVRHVRCI